VSLSVSVYEAELDFSEKSSLTALQP